MFGSIKFGFFEFYILWICGGVYGNGSFDGDVYDRFTGLLYKQDNSLWVGMFDIEHIDDIFGRDNIPYDSDDIWSI